MPPEKIGAYYPPAYLGDVRGTLQAFLSGELQKSRSWRRSTEKVGLVEKFCEGGRLLDVGCAEACFLLALPRPGWTPVGVEYIQEVVAEVRSRIPELEIHPGDIYNPRLEPRSFDVITFWHVFEHLYEPRRVLRRAGQLLRPGGTVFLSVPNVASLQARFFGRHWYAFDVPRHLHHYSPRSLEILLEEAGFEVEDHVFFSKLNDFHTLKHSLIHWSEEKFSSRVPYYLLKPLLYGFAPLESVTEGGHGSLTTVARRRERL